MIQFYYNAGPNPQKVALFLEEAGLAYEPIPLETRKGDQHQPKFLKINPNAKAPAIVDDGVAVFDSNAILLHLGRKTGQFMPVENPVNNADLLSWLMFIATGVGPYSGQSVHFQLHARGTLEYAVERYKFEAERHYKILDARLSDREWLVGEEYSIVDMALWGWARNAPRVFGKNEPFTEFINVNRWFATINQRPAVGRVDALLQRFKFLIDVDEEARKHMFPGPYHHA
ncbi:MAG: glutathione S-transferase family protein [Hyphomicrobiaceae bacterium]